MRSATGSAANHTHTVRITAVLLCLLASGARAETPKPEPTKVGTVTDKLGTRWTLNTGGGLNRSSLPFSRVFTFLLHIDGKNCSATTFSPVSASSTTRGANAATPAEPRPADLPRELAADAWFLFRYPEEFGIEWTRHVRFDSARGGMRFIDVMRNTSGKPRQLLVKCENLMHLPEPADFKHATTDRGDIVGLEKNNLPDEAAGVMLHYSPNFSAASPFFIFGKAREPWQCEQRQEGCVLHLEYQGTLAPGKRAVLVHWVAARGGKEEGAPEEAFQRFISDDRLIDAGVPKDWVPDVVNFSKEAFNPPAKPAITEVKLVMLEDLCKRLGIARDDKDHLVLDRDSKIEGELTAAKLTLSRGTKPHDLALAKIAAISGGAGKGREHRVFLRDGSVLAGRVSLEGARFISKGVGEVALNVDSLDQLILRTAIFSDGHLEGAASVAKTNRGEILYLASLPAKPLPGRTSAGVIDIAWSDITSIRERSNPDPCFVVTLKDGSRVVCLPGFQEATFRLANGEDWHAATELSGYTASAAELEALLAPEKESEMNPFDGWCELTRGSRWAGHAAEGELQIEAAAGVTKFRSTELKSIVRPILAPVAGAGIVFDIELTTGLKLRGRFVSSALRWQRGAQVLELPWSQVQELGTEAKKQ